MSSSVESEVARIRSYWARLGFYPTITARTVTRAYNGRDLTYGTIESDLINGLPAGCPASRVPVPVARRTA